MAIDWDKTSSEMCKEFLLVSKRGFVRGTDLYQLQNLTKIADALMTIKVNNLSEKSDISLDNIYKILEEKQKEAEGNHADIKTTELVDAIGYITFVGMNADALNLLAKLEIEINKKPAKSKHSMRIIKK